MTPPTDDIELSRLVYLGGTRSLAAVALLALAAAIISDAFGRHFWAHHPLLANLAASLIVVMLSVALVV